MRYLVWTTFFIALGAYACADGLERHFHDRLPDLSNTLRYLVAALMPWALMGLGAGHVARRIGARFPVR